MWRRLWMAILGILLVAALGMDTWTRFGINAILPLWGVDASIAHFEWHFAERGATIAGGQWSSVDRNSFAHFDTLTIQGIGWKRSGIALGHMDVGLAKVTIQSDNIASPDAPPFVWEDAWNGALRRVDIDTLAWDEIHARVDSQLIELTSGQVVHLGLGKEGGQLGSLTWGAATCANLTTGLQVNFSPSHLRGHWTPEEWKAESDGLNMPGLKAVGDISWPLMKGHGQVELDWTALEPFLRSTGAHTLMNDLELGGAQTRLKWDLDSSFKHVSMKGPEWLKIEGSVTGDDWQTSLVAEHVPQAYGSMFPATQLELEVEGNMENVQLSLAGDSTIYANASVGLGIPLVDWALGPVWPEEVSVHIERWGTWIADSAEFLDLSCDNVGNTVKLEAGQPRAPASWKLQGSWSNHVFKGESQVAMQGTSFSEESPLKSTWDVRTRDGEVSWSSQHVLTALADSVTWLGKVAGFDRGLDWASTIEGGGASIQTSGKQASAFGVLSVEQLIQGASVRWPTFNLEAIMSPENKWLEAMGIPAALSDSTTLAVVGNQGQLTVSLSVPEVSMGTLKLQQMDLSMTNRGGSTSAMFNGSTSMPNTTDEASQWKGKFWNDGDWWGELEASVPGQETLSWTLQAAHPDGRDDMWDWTLHEASIPWPGGQLKLVDAPAKWTSEIGGAPPLQLSFDNQDGGIGVVFQSGANGVQSVSLEGAFAKTDAWTTALLPSLTTGECTLRAEANWGTHVPEGLKANVELALDEPRLESVELSALDAAVTFERGSLYLGVHGHKDEGNFSIDVRGKAPVTQLGSMPLNVQVANAPLAWAKPLLDASVAQLEGLVDASLRFQPPWSTPAIRGQGEVKGLEVFVPSLGTSFGGDGAFQVDRDEVWLKGFDLRDKHGTSTRVEGVLMHEEFTNWNFNASAVDVPNNFVVMDLEDNDDLAVYGSLVAGGDVNVFFWNNQVEIMGDVVADAPTDFKLSMADNDEGSWNSTVRFLERCSLTATSMTPEVEELGVTFDLNIEVRPGAQMTIVTDPVNNANIVGSTRGNLRFVLEDWDHMLLTGELEIVEGQYTFALGPLLRKEFVAESGGRLLWDGDPYEGMIELDAVHSTRADVQTLLGSASEGRQVEDIDVTLHLNGPLLQPNIAFDVGSPSAPSIVAEAMATALSDETERTSQAIALLSLQEFLPQQINTLELGANGLQEYSIDVVTSQLGKWLSRINDDLDVGVRYDSQSLNSTSLTDGQDALQLALKASFFGDKLEVEGAVGSQDISQEALSEAHLQNIRFLYQLNEAKRLQLTGFSESQTSATQSANTTSQGVGIRWHKSFNWSWPWNQKEEDSQEESTP